MTDTYSITDIAERIASSQGMTKTNAVKFARALFGETACALNAGADVRVSGFGVFKSSVKEAHEARNPASGGTVSVPAKRKIKFSQSANVFTP